MGVATDDNAVPFRPVTSDPRAGLAASVGTVVQDGSGNTYLKVGSSDSDWILLEGWKYVTAAAPATTVSITGLDGDKDVAYDIFAGIKFNSAAANIDIRPNGLTTNRKRTQLYSVTGAAPAALTAADWGVIDTVATGTHSLLDAVLLARRGSGGRSIVTRGMEANGVTTVALLNECGIWNEDTVNITSLDFVSSVANGIGTGSFFCVKPKGLAR